LMACSRFESQLALYAGGDLAEDAVRELEEHLSLCPGCREVAEGLAQSQAALLRLGVEEVDGRVLADVRRRVMDEVGSRRPSWLYTLGWRHAVAAGLAVLVAIIGLWPRPAVPPPPAPPAFRLPAPEVAKSRPPATRHVVPVKPAPAAQEPLMVKMFTDDPDVVIVWFIDQNGEKL
jgi:anti-sigma factor RsiW